MMVYSKCSMMSNLCGLRLCRLLIALWKGFVVRLLLIALIFTVLAFPIFAQDNEPATDAIPEPTPTEIPTAYVEPETIVLRAEAGVFLVGDFYLVDPLSPTVILLHQLYTNRTSWESVTEVLLGAHYNVLAVDLRGYGESSGSINWHKAVGDTQLWFDWLRTEAGVRGDAISTMGSSMGSTLAIVGCANDALCKTSIAISPGWDYYGIILGDALSIGMKDRPMMILYAERDRWPALGMPEIEEVATGLLEINTFPANAHGMDVLKQHEETLPLILSWLELYSGR